MRFEAWHEAIDRGMQSYMLGLGPGPHLDIPPSILAARVSPSGDAISADEHPPLNGTPNFEAHNTYLDLFTQGGLLATGAFLWLMATTALATLRARQPGLLALIAGIMVFTTIASDRENAGVLVCHRAVPRGAGDGAHSPCVGANAMIPLATLSDSPLRIVAGILLRRRRTILVTAFLLTGALGLGVLATSLRYTAKAEVEIVPQEVGLVGGQAGSFRQEVDRAECADCDNRHRCAGSSAVRLRRTSHGPRVPGSERRAAGWIGPASTGAVAQRGHLAASDGAEGNRAIGRADGARSCRIISPSFRSEVRMSLRSPSRR